MPTETNTLLEPEPIPQSPCEIKWKDLSDRANAAATKYGSTRHALYMYKKHIKEMADSFTLNVACRTDYGNYYVGLNKLYNDYIDLRNAIVAPYPLLCNQTDWESKLAAFKATIAAQEGRVSEFYTKAVQYQTAKGFFGEEFNPWCTEILGENGNIGVVSTPTQETDAH